MVMYREVDPGSPAHVAFEEPSFPLFRQDLGWPVLQNSTLDYRHETGCQPRENTLILETRTKYSGVPRTIRLACADCHPKVAVATLFAVEAVQGNRESPTCTRLAYVVTHGVPFIEAPNNQDLDERLDGFVQPLTTAVGCHCDCGCRDTFAFTAAEWGQTRCCKCRTD